VEGGLRGGGGGGEEGGGGGGGVRSHRAVESKGRQNGQRAAQSIWKKLIFCAHNILNY